MIIYVYGKCSTCQQALRFLEKRKIDIIVREITQTPPSVSELQQMLEIHAHQIKKLMNTSGLLYREMNLSEKSEDMSTSEIIQLLTQHGMLVKRPFLIGENVGITGFNEKEWGQKFPSIPFSSKK